jgi:signal transduction histidine kinase
MAGSRALRSLLYTEDDLRLKTLSAALPITRRNTHKTLMGVLILGFALVIALLVIASTIAVQNTRAIHAEAQELAGEQALTARLINEIQTEQSAINTVFYQLTRDPESINREEVLAQLDSTKEGFARILKLSGDTPEANLWAQWTESAAAFSAEAKRLIATEDITEESLRSLVKQHEEVRRLVRDLVLASSNRAAAAERQITSESTSLLRQSGLLLGLSAILAFACAILTVRLTIQLFRRMEWQAGELSRVSWHMLQGQEATARRFSHELHDELGQSLTAVKANVAAITPENLRDRRRDCIALVDEAIGNVRELAQLLRPVILDDFGLDAGLRWLAEKFMQRTGIRVNYHSDFGGRLADQTETHIFRIAQEALTNVARHASATEVNMSLDCRDGKVWLVIRDNGRGMEREPRISDKPSLGMVGMRARARDAGGELTVESAKGAGLTLSVWVPAREQTIDAEQENTHIAGR